MKKTILIVVGIIVVLFAAMAFFGFMLEKKEVEEATPRFEELYKEAMHVYESDKAQGIVLLEDAMYYGHSHSLAAYQDALVTGYNEHYREGLNLLARHYREHGKKLEAEGRFSEALEIYAKIFEYTDQDESVAFKKGSDFDLLNTDIKRLKEKIE